jgi:polyisoprenoid-binding protein YceI
MNTLRIALIASLSTALPLSLAGCDSDEAPASAPEASGAKAEAEPDAEPQADPKPDAKAAPEEEPEAATPPAAPAAADGASDAFEIVASHAKPKPTDPAIVALGIQVVSAKFDPKNPAGGSATIEIDAASANSKSAMRDKHIASDDYLDSAANPKILVDVSDVAADGDAWKAKAKVTVRGKSIEWPIEFEIVETTETSIRIKGTHAFDRTSVGVGGPAAEGDSVADVIEARFSLTLTPSA